MSERWFTEHWMQLMNQTDELFHDVQHNAAEIGSERISQLVAVATAQRNAAEAALRNFAEQRQVLQQTLDELQRELAVAGRPLRGEVS